MDISLIICTYNRHKQLRACLDSIKKLETEYYWELVLVDNASTDQTAQLLTSFSNSAQFPVHIVYEKNQGLGNARNAGLRKSTGNIVSFTDDDCYPRPDYLNRIMESFSDDTIGFAGGRILLFDPEDFPVTIKTSEEKVEYLPRQFIHTGAIQGANMSFRREALIQSGGFDALMGAGKFLPAEDIDAVGRVSALGWKGVYDPASVVYHHHGRKTRDDVNKLLKQYDYGRGGYIAKSLFRKPVRLITLKNWWWSIKSQDPDRSLREVFGALIYMFLRATNFRKNKTTF